MPTEKVTLAKIPGKKILPRLGRASEFREKSWALDDVIHVSLALDDHAW